MKTKKSHKGRDPCFICGKRIPKFTRRGKMKWDRQHDVCLQCFRADLNRRQVKFSHKNFK